MAVFWAELPALVKLAALALAVVALLELGVTATVAGTLAAAVLGGRGWDPALALAAGAAAAVVVYVGECLLYPRTRCVWCRGQPKVGDGAGHFRNCWVCGGSGQRRRVGSKLLRRHRRFIGR